MKERFQLRRGFEQGRAMGPSGKAIRFPVVTKRVGCPVMELGGDTVGILAWVLLGFIPSHAAVQTHRLREN
jgi:hypothetical protein